MLLYYMHHIVRIFCFLALFPVKPVITAADDCKNRSHITGKWIYNVNATKNYYCCGYDKLDHRHNINECGPITLSGLSEFYGTHEWRNQAGGHACECDIREGRTTTNAREKFDWVPDTCTLRQFDAAEFCRALGNRTLYLEGDSTMQQAAHSLIVMLYRKNGADCINRIFFIKTRDQRLHQRLSDRMTMISKVAPDIVVLNIGAHANTKNDIILYFDELEAMLKSPWYRQISNEYKKNISFVYRTIHPGHLNCSTYNAPMSSFDRDTFPVYNASVDWYHWSDFPSWDELAIFSSHKLGFKVLDMAPLYQRPDSHPGPGDCLHYCLPGPLDLFSLLLFQMLHTKEI